MFNGYFILFGVNFCEINKNLKFGGRGGGCFALITKYKNPLTKKIKKAMDRIVMKKDSYESDLRCVKHYLKKWDSQ